MFRYAVIAAAMLIPGIAQAEGYPIRKMQGQSCPTGYFASGSSFCAPFRDAAPAVPKRRGETCPTGMYASGGACVSFR